MSLVHNSSNSQQQHVGALESGVEGRGKWCHCQLFVELRVVIVTGVSEGFTFTPLLEHALLCNQPHASGVACGQGGGCDKGSCAYCHSD